MGLIYTRRGVAGRAVESSGGVVESRGGGTQPRSAGVTRRPSKTGEVERALR